MVTIVFLLLIVFAFAVLAYLFFNVKKQSKVQRQQAAQVERLGSAERAERQRPQERQVKAAEAADNLREHIYQLQSVLDESRPKVCSWNDLGNLKSRLHDLSELTVKLHERMEDPNCLGTLKIVTLNGREMLYWWQLDVTSAGQIEIWIDHHNTEKLRTLSELMNWCHVAYGLLVTCMGLQLDVSEMNTNKDMNVSCWDVKQQLQLESKSIVFDEYRTRLDEALDRLKALSKTLA
jgi:hypothetical protein